MIEVLYVLILHLAINVMFCVPYLLPNVGTNVGTNPDPDPERLKHTESQITDIVSSLTVRSQAPLCTIQFDTWIIYARRVVTFGFFQSSHLLRINFSQLSDPRRDGGLNWPVVHPRFYSLIDSTS